MYTYTHTQSLSKMQVKYDSETKASHYLSLSFFKLIYNLKIASGKNKHDNSDVKKFNIFFSKDNILKIFFLQKIVCVFVHVHTCVPKHGWHFCFQIKSYTFWYKYQSTICSQNNVRMLLEHSSVQWRREKCFVFYLKWFYYWYLI